MRAVALCALGVLCAGGLSFACADACLQVQNILCECRGRTQDEINACQSTASTQEGLQSPTAAQNAACQPLIDRCQAAIDGGTNCAILQTVAGRQDCGITQEGP